MNSTTSSYFEGQYANSKLVEFGYNRDHKHGHEQVVIGLITTPDGCPVCVEVFPGNTQDASTVIAKITELRFRYGIKDIVFVGDRGMVTASNEAKLSALPAGDGIKIISTLTHREIVQMLARIAATALKSQKTKHREMRNRLEARWNRGKSIVQAQHVRQETPGGGYRARAITRDRRARASFMAAMRSLSASDGVPEAGAGTTMVANE